ncbi:c-type cytochrome biogenesis protein CcmI/CycH [Aquifex aeolicus]|uniref:Uncharacterized protein aq_1241 n=1 Tax=Aquifex aeolicus (strain VF5) TaxID=224324 RepID=Y1241_AQUAE|nr:hypothetical protein [Aquifex aeolicus]O67286.1 RecName: Full=Uncharacterized protein aq_1241 [Aquifex aeolicus VF5]AAC07250.1 putative protein [Aquifex aeolicus VF5]
MKWIFLLLSLLIYSCQELPKKYQTPEGKKILEKYKKQYVKGVVILDDKLKEKIPKGERYLIIAVMKEGSSRPVAVLRVKNPDFPYRFKITGKHKIVPEDFIEGKLMLTARISKEPTAGFKRGDLYGFAQAQAGDEDVKILINQVFEEKEK